MVSSHEEDPGLIRPSVDISLSEISASTPIHWRWMEFCFWCSRHWKWHLKIQQQHLFPGTMSLRLWMFHISLCWGFIGRGNSSKENCWQWGLWVIHSNWGTVPGKTQVFECNREHHKQNSIHARSIGSRNQADVSKPGQNKPKRSAWIETTYLSQTTTSTRRAAIESAWKLVSDYKL